MPHKRLTTRDTLKSYQICISPPAFTSDFGQRRKRQSSTATNRWERAAPDSLPICCVTRRKQKHYDDEFHCHTTLYSKIWREDQRNPVL
ncbi:hypothetical protein QE152_g35679 [Popillia japonica]|uniref:Uncharacterized protein n=1 Tax=Popillia japonica TaxID=7064 RepID=A0AAW1IFG5_POPJA